MSPDGKAITIEERIKAEDRLMVEMSHTGEGKVLWIAGLVAVFLHVIVMFVHFPKFETKIDKKPDNVIVVKKYVPPPPKVEKRQIKKKQFTRKVPIPDPTPDEPEPIREPEPEIEPDPLPPDVEFLIGVPEAPPPSGPLLAGVEGVTLPVRLDESYIKPEYPELARVARIEGRVIIQAIILKDGSVGDVQVLNCNRPNMGFEEAASSAVQQWRYKPAMQGAKTVDVYFTVVVEFELS